MKAQDLLSSYRRKEKVAKIFALVSIIAIVICIISGILYLIYKEPLYDKISVYGFTIFIMPFVLLQFFMTAGIYGNGIGPVYIVFYLLIFPFVDMLFFSGIDTLYHIVPTYYYSHNKGIPITLREIEEFRRQAWLYLGGIYFSIIGLGLIWRIVKNSTKNVALAF